MDYFVRRHEVRGLTRMVFAMTVFALGVLTLCLTAVIAVTIHSNGWIGPGRSAWNADTAALTGLVVFGWAGLMLWRRTYRTRAGGRAEARRVGAAPNQGERDELIEVAEELAVAFGMPTPEVWIVDDDGINAFAVGTDPRNAVVIVTRASLEELALPELRGMIAHELARIADGDMLLYTRVACFTEVLVAPAVLARWLKRRADRTRWTRPCWLTLAALIGAAGSLSYVFARIIKVTTLRLRGHTADTTAIVAAADPHGLNALLRRTADDDGTCRADLSIPRAAEFDHAFIAPQLGIALGRNSLLRTHSSTAERTRRIGLAHGQVHRELSYAEATIAQLPLPADEAVERLGDLEFEHVRRGASIIDAIPKAVRAALRQPTGAHAVVCALLYRGSSKPHRRQHELFVERGCPAAVLAARDLHEYIVELDPACWSSLADLAQPAIRAMTSEQRTRLEHDLRLLANGNADALEFFVAHVWLHHLRGAWSRGRLFALEPRVEKTHWQHPVSFLLALSRLVHWDQRTARRAFGDALRVVGVAAGRRIFANGDSRLVAAIDRALRGFADLQISDRKRIVYAALLAMAGDDPLTPSRIETARAIGKAIGCVIPPQLDLSRATGASDDAPDRVLAELWQGDLDAVLL